MSRNKTSLLEFLNGGWYAPEAASGLNDGGEQMGGGIERSYNFYLRLYSACAGIRGSQKQQFPLEAQNPPLVGSGHPGAGEGTFDANRYLYCSLEGSNQLLCEAF